MLKISRSSSRSMGMLILLSFSFILVSLQLIHSGVFTDQVVPLRTKATASEEWSCELPWWDGAMDNCKSVVQTFINQKNTTRSYCGKRADVLGEGQKVITYCLYGDFDRYASGLPEILKTAQNFYPGWAVRVYTEPKNYTRELVPLMRQYRNLYICDVTNLPGDLQDWREGNSMLWRAAVLGDELVDVFVSRDIDAVIIEREVDAVKEFLDSGKSLHSMKDHPGHKATIMGGMYGVRQTQGNREFLNGVRRELFAARAGRLNDQQLLELHLYSKLMGDGDLLSHDSYFCNKFKNTRPFPTQRQNRTFIGNRRYRSNHRQERNNKVCPVECRPSSHPDWKHC